MSEVIPRPCVSGSGAVHRSGRAGRASWLTLLGSISLHAAVFAVAAHFVMRPGDLPAGTSLAEGLDQSGLFLSVKVNAPAQVRSGAQTTRVIRKTLPVQLQRVMVAARTDLALPAPAPAFDLPEALPPDTKTARSAPTASHDAPPSKKIASRAGKGAGKSGANQSSGGGAGLGNATAPKPVATRVPVYPFAAKKRGEQGMVLVRVRVNESGRVVSSTVHRSSGHAQLDEAAVACVWKWSFTPGQSAGRAVQSSAVVRVSFRLEG